MSAQCHPSIFNDYSIAREVALRFIPNILSCASTQKLVATPHDSHDDLNRDSNCGVEYPGLSSESRFTVQVHRN